MDIRLYTGDCGAKTEQKILYQSRICDARTSIADLTAQPSRVRIAWSKVRPIFHLKDYLVAPWLGSFRRTIIKASGVGAAGAAMPRVVQDELCMHRPPPTRIALTGAPPVGVAPPASQVKTTYLFLQCALPLILMERRDGPTIEASGRGYGRSPSDNT